MTEEQKKKCIEIVGKYNNGMVSEVDAILEISNV